MIVVVNNDIEVRNKAGNLLWTASLLAFFRMLGCKKPFDPKIVYKSHEKCLVVSHYAGFDLP